jgi:hypothetical protein
MEAALNRNCSRVIEAKPFDPNWNMVDISLVFSPNRAAINISIRISIANSISVLDIN